MPARAVAPKGSTAVSETALVALDDLVAHPANPRRGNVQAIAESLKVHRQYRALVVQRGSRHVLAGNHTLAALRLNGETHALVHWLDVDDDEAARIMVADNRLSDIASNDTEMLAEVLQGLPTLDGTGYDSSSLDLLLASLSESTEVDPTAEWAGMPEFVSENLMGNAIIVRFASSEDRQAFGVLVGQSLTDKTRAIWYPEAATSAKDDQRYATNGT